MARKNKTEPKRPIESYEHRNKQRLNNPPAGLVTPDTDPDAGQKKKTYAYDPHLDPQLVWAGKAEHTSFEVPTVSLHVHERIDLRTIIKAVRKLPSPQPSPNGRGWRGAPGEDPLPSREGGRRPGEGKKPLPRDLLEFARRLRKEQTDAERLMWSLLRDRLLAGFKFRRQHPVALYILDFYCHEASLAVELDGGQHNEPDERARDTKRSAFLEAQSIRVLRFWNNDVFQNTEGVLEAIFDALTQTFSQREREDALTPALSQRERGFTADASIARSGETLRQAEWRDELLRAGIRGKAGQYIRFSRLEPLPGCRWLHADGEVVDSGQGIVDSGQGIVGSGQGMMDSKKKSSHAKLSTDHYSLSTNRVVVSFGPEYAPLEQRQVQRAWEEAQQLVPKPKLLIFAAFQFDPEAAKDIDEMKPELVGMQFLKVQMNADLLTDDLKKKRASHESFWLIGQPDVVVDSEQWIVNSRKEALAPYDIIAKLSGARSLAEINGLSRDDLSVFIAIAQRRDLWDAFATDAGGRVDTGKHRGRTGAAREGGVPAFPGRGAGLPGRIGDTADFVQELEVLSDRDRRKRIEGLRGNREIADRARQITSSLTGPLSTIHYSQVTIHGFDYYNTKTGQIESGGADKIAVWLLDTDYDERSLYPRQVFFPMAGENEGWARLARNLKAEIDEERIEAYRGTVSLPFELGEHKRIAVKIVDDRGIESLKVLEVE
ncbi:MAG: endonuclease domain-containing protein [Aggregatilineaceae bacterium]